MQRRVRRPLFGGPENVYGTWPQLSMSRVYVMMSRNLPVRLPDFPILLQRAPSETCEYNHKVLSKSALYPRTPRTQDYNLSSYERGYLYMYHQATPLLSPTSVPPTGPLSSFLRLSGMSSGRHTKSTFLKVQPVLSYYSITMEVSKFTPMMQTDLVEALLMVPRL